MLPTSNRHRIAKIVLVTVIFLLFALMFTPFFMSILLAVLFAFALENHVSRFSKKKFRRPWLTLAILISLFLAIALPVSFVAIKAVSTVKKYADVGLQTTPLYLSTEKIVHTVAEQLGGLAERFNLDLAQLPQLSNLLSQTATLVGTATTAMLASLPDLILNIFVFALVLYYLLTQSTKLKNQISNLNLVSASELNQLIEITKKSSYTALIASALIGCVQAGTLSIVAYFFGFTEFMLLFVVTFIFSLIPVIGAAPIAIFLALTSFIQGNSGTGISMLVLAGVVGSIDNIIKPMIVNSNDEVHPVIALLSLIGAIIVFGAPGILIGPVVTDLAFRIGGVFFPAAEES